MSFPAEQYLYVRVIRRSTIHRRSTVMRPLFQLLLGLCIFGTPTIGAFGQERDKEPVYQLKPALPDAKPLEVKERQTGWYSAVSKLNNTDTRDGIGVRWNWPKELGNKPWRPLPCGKSTASPSLR